ncbi:MAG TPA: hypothetical protein VF722_03140 [Gemmatimonadaceae bacterium]
MKMSPASFAAARTTIAKSDADLASELGVAVSEVKSWAAGQPVPEPYAQHLRWLAASTERRAALAASGLPECEWVTKKEATLRRDDSDAVAAFAKSLSEHAKHCPACQARNTYVKERFGRMPAIAPVPLWARPFFRIAAMPSWAQPAAYGALMLGGITSIRALAALPFVFSKPVMMGGALVAVIAAAGAGALGGLAYSVTRPALKHLGRAGDYVSGVVAAVGYMGAFALAAPVIAPGDPMIQDRSDLVIFAIVAVFFGLLLGHNVLRSVPAD